MKHISQLIRVRNAFVPKDHPRAYGYLIGRDLTEPQSHGTVFDPYSPMVISWIDGTIENEEQHKRNVAWQPPSVWLVNET